MEWCCGSVMWRFPSSSMHGMGSHKLSLLPLLSQVVQDQDSILSTFRFLRRNWYTTPSSASLCTRTDFLSFAVSRSSLIQNAPFNYLQRCTVPLCSVLCLLCKFPSCRCDCERAIMKCNSTAILKHFLVRGWDDAIMDDNRWSHMHFTYYFWMK